MLAGLGLGAGVAVGSVGAAIGLASARQEVKWQYDCKTVENYKVFFYLLVINPVVIPKLIVLIPKKILFRQLDIILSITNINLNTKDMAACRPYFD